jgi:Flp pilus assembly protein TadG
VKAKIWNQNCLSSPKGRSRKLGCLQMKTKSRFSRRKMIRAQSCGAELVEMALILPILLSLLIGVFWAARAYNIYETITRAAREGARVAVAPACSACGGAVPAVGNVENAVLNSLTASSMDATKITIPAGCAGNLSSKICYSRDVVLNAGPPSELGTVVSLTYPFSFRLPFVNVPAINITTKVQMRQE